MEYNYRIRGLKVKQLIMLLLLSYGLILTGCDNKTKQKINTKADGAIESIDKQVDKIAQQPNVLQPIAKQADEQINTVHSFTHSNTNAPATPAKASSPP